MKYRTGLLSDSSFIKQLSGFISSLDKGYLPLPDGKVSIFLGRTLTGDKQPNGNTHVPFNALDKSAFASSESFTIEHASLPLRHKGQNNSNSDVTIKFDNKISHFTVSLEFGNNQVTKPEDALAVSSKLLVSFPKIEISPLVDENIESLVSDLQHTRDTISAKTEKSIGDLIAAIAEAHKQSTERIDQQVQKRDNYYETLSEKHRAKVEAEESRIRDLERALSDKEAELNLKEPIGERRKIHESLRTSLLQQINEFKPSGAVGQSRWVVRYVNWTVIGAAAAAFIFFASNQPTAETGTGVTPLDYYFYFKLAATAAVFFGFSAAYIRWESRWVDKLADTEFQLRDKAVDIERSAWLVETVEALTRDDKQLPDGLLPLLGHNLFNTKDSTESESEALSHFLQHLVGKKGTFEAKVPGGGSVKLDADGTRPKHQHT
jgi:hypothetical protein